mgnify:CR=1 FL=1
MDIRRFAGEFPVALRQKEIGADRNKNHFTQPKHIALCYV